METASLPVKRKKRVSLFVVILAAGLITGTLDALSAMLINYKLPPASIWRYVARGVFAKDELSPESMVTWGLVFHYFIAYSFTTLLLLCYPTIKMIFKYKYLIGVLYGIFVWCIMNLIVVPLSHTPKLHFAIGTALINMLVLIVAIGIPSSLMAYRYYSPKYKN